MSSTNPIKFQFFLIFYFFFPNKLTRRAMILTRKKSDLFLASSLPLKNTIQVIIKTEKNIVKKIF